MVLYCQSVRKQSRVSLFQSLASQRTVCSLGSKLLCFLHPQPSLVYFSLKVTVIAACSCLWTRMNYLVLTTSFSNQGHCIILAMVMNVSVSSCLRFSSDRKRCWRQASGFVQYSQYYLQPHFVRLHSEVMWPPDFAPSFVSICANCGWHLSILQFHSLTC